MTSLFVSVSEHGLWSHLEQKEAELIVPMKDGGQWVSTTWSFAVHWEVAVWLLSCPNDRELAGTDIQMACEDKWAGQWRWQYKMTAQIIVPPPQHKPDNQPFCWRGGRLFYKPDHTHCTSGSVLLCVRWR